MVASAWRRFYSRCVIYSALICRSAPDSHGYPAGFPPERYSSRNWIVDRSGWFGMGGDCQSQSSYLRYAWRSEVGACFTLPVWPWSNLCSTGIEHQWCHPDRCFGIDCHRSTNRHDKISGNSQCSSIRGPNFSFSIYSILLEHWLVLVNSRD